MRRWGRLLHPRGLLSRRRPPAAKYAALAHWKRYGLYKPNQWAAAEYGYIAGLEALRRQWCPARDRHWWERGVGLRAPGKVFEKVWAAVQERQKAALNG